MAVSMPKPSVTKRETELLNNSIILSAIYMDIFNIHLLTSEQKQKARKAVVELGLRLRGLSEEDSANVTEPEIVHYTSAGGLDSENSSADLENCAERKASANRHLVTWRWRLGAL
jgi:hypothetical protein